jgi:hypothetical protein
MKKLTILTLVFILLAVTVVPALAAGGPPPDRGTGIGCGNGSSVNQGSRAPFALAGTITAIDPVVHSVTVTVVCGNRLVQPYFGQDVTLRTNEATRFLLRNPEGAATPITFEDLAVGQKISSNGSLVDGTWTAIRITVGAQLICLP